MFFRKFKSQGAPKNSVPTEEGHITEEMYKKNKELSEKNKVLSLLREIDETVLSSLADAPLVAQKIADTITKRTNFSLIGIYIATKGKEQLTQFAISCNGTSEVRSKLIKIPTLLLSDSTSLIVRSVLDKKELPANQFSQVIGSSVSQVEVDQAQKDMGIKSFLVVPLSVRGEMLGTMVVGLPGVGESISPSDRDLLSRLIGTVGIALDNTLLYQETQEANKYLTQLDKMKDEFISMASHELNTPLAAIEGYLSMILDEHMGKIDDKSKEYLSRAYASSKRLAELILDLLNVSRVEQGRLKMKFSETNLVDLAESVIRELQLKADTKNIYLKLDANKKQVPITWCDPDRIREVLVNLTGNAIKFTDKGGVTIKIEKGQGETIRSSIIDTGRGIAKEDQGKLFQKFSQIKREVDEHQGTGLGLYISKNFVELHKGTLTVESDTGKGAVFTFELPIIKEPPREVSGAMLEGSLSTPQIEAGRKEIPTVITDSVKRGV